MMCYDCEDLEGCDLDESCQIYLWFKTLTLKIWYWK